MWITRNYRMIQIWEERIQNSVWGSIISTGPLFMNLTNCESKMYSEKFQAVCKKLYTPCCRCYFTDPAVSQISLSSTCLVSKLYNLHYGIHAIYTILYNCVPFYLQTWASAFLEYLPRAKPRNQPQQIWWAHCIFDNSYVNINKCKSQRRYFSVTHCF